jgi:[ribosomal protein S5]-alanine N-acetyltransferase
MIDYSFFQPLSTTRLLLRRLQETDEEAIFFIRSDKEMNKYISRVRQTSLEESKAFIDRITNNINTGTSLYWAISTRERTTLIGTVCLWNFSTDGRTAELGYELHPSFQGKGIMDEAVKAVINYAFRYIGLEKIVAYTHFGNLPSLKLLTRNGFKHDPLTMDPDVPENVIYYLGKG